MSDLDSVINSAIDALGGFGEEEATPDAAPVEASADPAVEAGTEPEVEVEAPVEAADATEEAAPVEEGASPVDGEKTALEAAKAAEDAFAKKHGIAEREPSGRENRIPYSRVKKITENAVKEATDTFSKEKEIVTKELEGWKSHATQVRQRVEQFEQVMVQNKPAFLQWLAQNIPGYNDIFNQIAGSSQQEAQPKTPSDMPQPDQRLADGSTVYSEEGLQKLLEWQENRVASRLSNQVQQQMQQFQQQVVQRYAPIETEWQAHQRFNQLVPQVQKQIEEARQWPGFTDNEADITVALNSNPRLSLREAYYQVLLPKVQADRDRLQTSRESMRSDILQEIKKAPISTAAPKSPVKPQPIKSQVGPRKIEDIIEEQAKLLQERLGQ